jgi:hypothetical protein
MPGLQLCCASACFFFSICRVFLPPHPRAGFSEVLIDGLPGTPDGISRSHDGDAFWVSLVSNIPPITKWFGSALVRGLLGHIPENMRPQVGCCTSRSLLLLFVVFNALLLAEYCCHILAASVRACTLCTAYASSLSEDTRLVLLLLLLRLLGRAHCRCPRGVQCSKCLTRASCCR